jgi:hypothetical protein
MDKFVLKDEEQFKRFSKRVFDRTDLEGPKKYPCLCVYCYEEDWDRCGDLTVEMLDFVYQEDFNKRHRRQCDIENAKTRRLNKKQAEAWRLKEPETFIGMSDGEVLNFVFKRIMDKFNKDSGRVPFIKNK